VLASQQLWAMLFVVSPFIRDHRHKAACSIFHANLWEKRFSGTFCPSIRDFFMAN
jgi:hypothetical protein